MNRITNERIQRLIMLINWLWVLGWLLGMVLTAFDNLISPVVFFIISQAPRLIWFVLEGKPVLFNK